MIRKYSLAKDGAKLLAPDFKVRELRCRDGSDTVMVDDALMLLLQCIREHFGKAVTITSGYRTAAHNAAVGGAKSSQHLLGRAADIRVQGVSVEDVAAYAESLMPDWGGVGRYPVKAGRSTGWVHVDTRADKHHLSHHRRRGDPDRRADRQRKKPSGDRHKAGGTDPGGAGA